MLQRIKDDKDVQQTIKKPSSTSIGSKKFKGGPTRAYSGVSYVTAWETEDPQILDMVESVKVVPCAVPLEILSVVRALDSEYSNVEWSILCKASWNAEMERFELGTEYFLPKQEVSAAHIDYEEDNIDFNTVIHKHPSGCLRFSSTDESYINRNFTVSLLWVNNHFEYGIANVRTKDMGDVRLRFKLSPFLNYNIPETLPENHAEKIIKKTYTYSGGKYGTTGYTGYGGMGSGVYGGDEDDEYGTGWWAKYHGAYVGRKDKEEGASSEEHSTSTHRYQYTPSRNHGNVNEDDSYGVTELGNSFGNSSAAFSGLEEDDDGIVTDDGLPVLRSSSNSDMKKFDEMSAEEWEDYLSDIQYDIGSIPKALWAV